MHTSSSLTISDVREEDEGVYVCTLRGLDINGEPVTVNQSIAISVIGKYTVTSCRSWYFIYMATTTTGVFSLQKQKAVMQLCFGVDSVAFS